ncbi:MAG TPA: outer membrane lipoprotein carrier protein LolA [Polyangiaceae bacterium]|nr:outer membrane lipoprotein carrier protein LolA [Polyangiaceae bacterium]
MKTTRFVFAGLLLGLALQVAPGAVGIALADKPAAPATTPLSANDIADRVQNFYDKSKTFRAKFEQRYFVAAYRKTKNSGGTVVFEKPGKMSWRYETNGNRVVSDGKTIKVYDKETQQMYEQNIEKSPYPGALSFLLGGGNLKKEFNLERLDEKALGYEGGFVLKGVPKTATPAYQSLLLYVDGATYQVRRVLMIDAQQNRNRFDFVDPVVNQPVDKKEFEFVAPPGTQIIKP